QGSYGQGTAEERATTNRQFGAGFDRAIRSAVCFVAPVSCAVQHSGRHFAEPVRQRSQRQVGRNESAASPLTLFSKPRSAQVVNASQKRIHQTFFADRRERSVP